MSTTATAEIDELAARIARRLQEDERLRVGPGFGGTQVTDGGCTIPWWLFGTLLVVVGRQLVAEESDPGGTTDSEAAARKMNWKKLIGKLLIAAGEWFIEEGNAEKNPRGP